MNPNLRSDLIWGLCSDPKCSTCIARKAAVDRIDALEAALRDIVETDSFTTEAGVKFCKQIARKALEASS